MTNKSKLTHSTPIDQNRADQMQAGIVGRGFGAFRIPYDSRLLKGSDVRSIPTDTVANGGGGNIGVADGWDVESKPLPLATGQRGVRETFGPALPQRADTRTRWVASEAGHGRWVATTESPAAAMADLLADMADDQSSESMGPWSSGDVLSTPLDVAPAELIETVVVWQCPTHGETMATYRNPDACCGRADKWSATLPASLDRKSFARGSGSATRTASTVATDTTLGRIAPKGAKGDRMSVPAMVNYSAPKGTVTMVETTDRNGRTQTAPVVRPRTLSIGQWGNACQTGDRETMILTARGMVPRTDKGNTGKATPLTGAERTARSRARKASTVIDVPTVDAALLAKRADAAAARRAKRASRVTIAI